MDNSIYVALSRQLALFRDMDVTANNIANANTTGFDAEHIMFDSYVTKDVNRGDRNSMAFANDISTYRDTENGPMQVTGNDLDVAIQGSGYFAVETPLGTRYTRAGSFRLGAGGALITTDGYPVLDASNTPITLPDDATTIEIGEAGNIKVNGQDFTTLSVVQFENPQMLERAGNRLYKSDLTPSPATSFRIAQGMLESSNVQPVLELTHMMDVSRGVDNTAKFIEIVYDLERKNANAWAQQS